MSDPIIAPTPDVTVNPVNGDINPSSMPSSSAGGLLDLVNEAIAKADAAAQQPTEIYEQMNRGEFDPNQAPDATQNPEPGNPAEPSPEPENEQGGEPENESSDPQGDEPGEPENEEGGEPTQPKTSPRATQKFAEMRVQLREQEKKIKELQEQLKAAPVSDDEKAELEKYRNAFNAYAFRESEEYKNEVTVPFEKANASLNSIIRTNALDADETFQKINAIVENTTMDSFDREEAYLNIAESLGITPAETAKFVRMAIRRNEIVQKHWAFEDKAQEYANKFMSSLTPEGKYEVDLTKYTQENLAEMAKSLGLETVPTEETLKRARHLGHKIDNEAFMRSALLDVATSELNAAREEIAALKKKIGKLRGAAPSVNKGVAKPVDSTEKSESGKGEVDLSKPLDLMSAIEGFKGF